MNGSCFQLVHLSWGMGCSKFMLDFKEVIECNDFVIYKFCSIACDKDFR